jgi:hypothetical protein
LIPVFIAEMRGGSSNTLQDILKLSNNPDSFLRIKVSVYPCYHGLNSNFSTQQDLGTITKDHLNPNKTATLQKDVLNVIEEEVIVYSSNKADYAYLLVA